MEEEKPRRRHRKRPDGSAELNNSVDRGDGRTSFGTFPKGRSGNPGGRPPGALNASTIIRQELTEKVIMKTPAGNKSVSKFAASVAKLTNIGLTQNSLRALERVIALGLSVEDKADPKRSELPINDADRAVLALLAKRLNTNNAGDDDSAIGDV